MLPSALRITLSGQGRSNANSSEPSLRPLRPELAKGFEPHAVFLGGRTQEDRYALAGTIWNLLGNYTATLQQQQFNEARLFTARTSADYLHKSGAGGSTQLAKAPVGSFAHIEYPGALFGCPPFTGEGEENVVLTDNLRCRGPASVEDRRARQSSPHHIDVTNYHDGSGAIRQMDFSIEPIRHLSRRVYRKRLGPPSQEPTSGKLLLHSRYWQAIDRLTVNLGLRYDVDRSVTAGNDFRRRQKIRASFTLRWHAAAAEDERRLQQLRTTRRFRVTLRAPDARRFWERRLFTIRTITISTPSTS